MLCAIGAALVVWRRGDDGSSPVADPHTAAEREKLARNAKAAGAHPMAWLAQRNASARRIAGIVEKDGAPVEGATVRLGSEASRAGAIPEPTLVTAADGRFDFGLQIATRFAVIAEKPKLSPAATWLDLNNPKTPTEDLHLALHACDASIHGTIRDAGGGVISHARVALVLGGSGISGGTEADDLGAYELCVPVGWAEVVVSAEGYARTVDIVEGFGAVRRDFALVPGATVVGRVVHARDRSPVAGAHVELRPEAMAGSNVGRNATQYATSDDAGAFHVDGVMPGPYAVLARGDGLASTRAVYVVAEAGETPEEVVCVLAETTSISGKVIEHGTAKPIAGVSVWMESSRDDDAHAKETVGITQTDGSFVIDNLLPGEYTPSVQRHELRNQPPSITLANAAVGGVVLEVDRLGSITGRITRAGKPVDGVEVGLRNEGGGMNNRAARSEHDGRYEIRDVVAGTYRVYAESKREGAFTQGPTVIVTKGENRTGVDIEMELAGSIAGVVVDQNDAPVAGVVVTFSLLAGRDFGFATTAEDGTFKATALSGGGEYVYQVQPSQRSSITHPPAVGKRHPPIAVRDGATHVTGVRIKIRREQLAITGRVLDASGKPIAGARVEIEPAVYAGQPSMSDDTGAFTIRGLPVGTYQLAATIAGRAAFATGIAAGRSDVVVKFAETGTIEGTLEGFTDEPDVTASGMGTAAHATVNNATFRIRNLAKGTYRLQASSPTGGAVASVSVAAEPAKVVLRREGYGTIAGTITDEVTKQPRANMYCEAIVDSDNGGGRSATARTDARGNYRLERVMAGDAQVWCNGARGTVKVVEGETARLDLVAKPRTPPRSRGHIGLEVEYQLGDARVRSVEAGGPAARAGIAVGDIVVKLDDIVVEPYMAFELVSQIEAREVGSTIKLTVERNDKEIDAQIKIEAAR